jgi:hypothetical protein
MLRHRHKDKEVIDIVRNFDAFPKTEEDFQEMSPTRGTSNNFKILINFLNKNFYFFSNKVSIIIFLIISVLVVFEYLYYSEKEVQYKYRVDFDHER